MPWKSSTFPLGKTSTSLRGDVWIKVKFCPRRAAVTVTMGRCPESVTETTFEEIVLNLIAACNCLRQSL